MDYIKISGKDAKLTSWTYDPSRATEDERWLRGDKVRCEVFPLPEQGKTIVDAIIEAGAYHGRTVAKSDYYYKILLGRGEFFFYEKEKLTEKIPVVRGDVLIIPEGTDYDYQAQSQDLRILLVMNNLWDVDNE